ncbi:MAG TPA: hypothetical protein PK472_00315 [Pseudomonadota bacterium]|nr:hypothetical protein [Pseudomonadota bacterium]HND12332.1 hypothetical protein [Pseudomonadota bacterium]HNN53359.1 hypothetical protein [Pseudomonadota bacterium]
MGKRPGQNSGHAASDDAPPSGWGWAEYLASILEECGTLTAVAWKLIEHGDGDEDVASVERALRRLRQRGSRDGGLWGQRLLRRFGVPRSIEEKLRWMGLYHSPFNDLPISLCEDQLRLWDQPPIATSRARIWLPLAATSVALRRRDFQTAELKLDEAQRLLLPSSSVESARADARIEAALVRAYLQSRTASEDEVDRSLQEAERELMSADLSAADRACFTARLCDQRAYARNRVSDHEGALQIFLSLPTADVHPFASYRRDAGLAYGYLRLGHIDLARVHAQRATEHAGDGGYTRLRVMSLILLARVESVDAGNLATARHILHRAQAIAERLADAELTLRVKRAAERLPSFQTEHGA